MNVTRRLRGLVGMATTWGVCFSALSTTTLLITRLVRTFPPDLFGPRLVAMVAVRGFVVGAAAGALFALALTAVERRRTLSGLSPKRVALWGFLGTAALPVIFGALTAPDVLRSLPVGVIASGSLLYGVVGSAIATTIVGVARRAPAQAIEAAERDELLRIDPPAPT
jgi:hypothetical protein